MKRILSIVVLLVITVTLKAQDIVVIKHTNYTTHFSKSKRYPVLVEWETTKESRYLKKFGHQMKLHLLTEKAAGPIILFNQVHQFVI